MEINDMIFEKGERILFSLRKLYLENGYRNYRMNKFEEYDLYAENKDFLVSDNVITFTDTDGKLLALKPDVTLSIIKNSKDLPQETQKVCYNENVYRVSKGAGSFKEIMQAGVECFGKVKDKDVLEVLTLAAKSLELISPAFVLALSDLDLVREAMGKNVSAHKVKELYAAMGDKNLAALEASMPNRAALVALCGVSGALPQVLPRLTELVAKYALKKGASFLRLLNRMAQSKYAGRITVDFSVVGDTNYYNGLIFKGYVPYLSSEVLSGGQYDNLLKKMSRDSRAIGFAVYTDELDLPQKKQQQDEYVNVALPKGRLGEKAYAAFAAAGYECPSILEPNRKLVFENEQNKVRYFWVKPSDIAIYVERGAADVGVAGKDILEEYEPDVYELADLGMGKCKMAVAAPLSFTDDPAKTLRVATKFSRIARSYYQSKGRNIDIIHLNGSIEIAPILGLSDVIVDIVETGRTLQENNLHVVEDILPISARLIANKASYKFKSDAIERLTRKLTEKEN